MGKNGHTWLYRESRFEMDSDDCVRVRKVQTVDTRASQREWHLRPLRRPGHSECRNVAEGGGYGKAGERW